jgi:hypothetical protein
MQKHQKLAIRKTILLKKYSFFIYKRDSPAVKKLSTKRYIFAQLPPVFNKKPALAAKYPSKLGFILLVCCYLCKREE